MKAGSGSLRESILIESQSSTQDAYGGSVTTWVTFATVWAGKQDLTGREFLAAAATQNSVLTKFTIRLRAGVLPSMRITHGADVYNIEAVLADGRDALLLMCSKGLTNG